MIAGIKYMFVRGETGEFVIGKKGNEGVLVYKCNTCLVVAYHNDSIQAGACNLVVGKLVDFLKENGI